MMKFYQKNKWCWLLVVATFWSSCRKNDEKFLPDPTTVGDITTQILKNVPQTDDITVFKISNQTTDTILSTTTGIRLVFNDLQNLFVDVDGKLVNPENCGSLLIRVQEVTTRSAQIAQNFASFSNQIPLETGGFIKIELLCGTQPLGILSGRNYKIYLPVAQPSDLKPNMNTFSAATNAAGEVVDWLPQPQQVYFANWTVGSDQIFGYELVARQAGWLAAARFSTAPTLVSFCINLPNEFHHQNTIVWAWLEDSKTLLKMEGTQQAGQFCIKNAPLGSPARLAVVSKLKDDWKFCTQKIEISNDQLVNLQPESVTSYEIVELLRSF